MANQFNTLYQRLVECKLLNAAQCYIRKVEYFLQLTHVLPPNKLLWFSVKYLLLLNHNRIFVYKTGGWLKHK